MLYLEKWKVYLIAGICALGVLYALPNLMGPRTVEWMQSHLPSFLPSRTVNLGLDLRGGSHLLLEVETDAHIEELMHGLVDQTRTELRKEKIGYTDLGLGQGVVRFKLTDSSLSGKTKEIIHDMDRDLDVEQSNGEFKLRMAEAKIIERTRNALEQSIEVVRRRIDETGTREPSIQREGDNRILVQLPGVDDPERIKNLLGQTAKLSFRFVDESATASPATILPPGTERLPSAETQGQYFVVQKRIMGSGDTLEDAQPSFQDGEPVVSFRFNSQGGKRFGEATRQNVGKLFAIVLDNKVISAPVIREPILGGSGVISGHFTTQSAQDLALLLRAGALPAPIKVLEERTVGPGLGADSIHAGTTACLVGLGLAMLFMFLAYGGVFGLFSNIALLFNMALLFAALSILQATLTLPGIAGIILTIGMSLDANVLVFERIREELRLGRSPLSSIDAGFSRALPAIIDANLTTLIASVLMFIFGSGPVKGFAVTLSIGIITSIFSAIMVTRLQVVGWLNWKKPKALPI